MRDDDLAGELARTVSGLHRASRRRTGAMMPGGALPAAQRELLVVVDRTARHRRRGRRHELHLAGNSVSALVNQLVEAGLLRRETDPADRRAARLFADRARRTSGWPPGATPGPRCRPGAGPGGARATGRRSRPRCRRCGRLLDDAAEGRPGRDA